MNALPLLLLAAVVQDAPKHNYDLKHVLWKLSIDMGKESLNGDVTNTLTLTEDAKVVWLHAAELNFGKVTVDGKDAKFTLEENKINITLPEARKSGETLKVRTLYTVKPSNGFYFVPAYRAFPAKTPMVYTQGQGEDNHFWLPTYDYPDDKATTECYVDVPKHWTAISNGALVGVETKGATKTFHWDMKQPHSTYLISLVAGEYVKGGDKWKGIPVEYYVPPGLEKEGKASFGNTSQMIDLFSKLTGVDYPYDKFAQEVVGDFLYGGMENTTAVTQTIRTLHNVNSEPVSDSTYLVAHELAHQWFGDLITCRTWEHSWLNEGFASTLPMFWNRHIQGEERFELDRYNNFEAAINSIGSRDRPARPGSAGEVKEVTMGSVYDGGASRIMMLYRMMGEETFWKAINAFLEQYKFQPVTTPEFFQVMAKVSGQDFARFQSQWFHTGSTPSLSASIEGTKLKINQLEPFYTFELPVWILDEGAWVKKSLPVTGASSVLELGPLAGKPFLIDPECWTLMELKYKVTFAPADVAAMYRLAPNAAGRARIVGHLFDSIPVSHRIAIGHSENFYGLLQLIAGHMGQEGSSYLLELTRHADKRVVNTAVVLLGGLKGNDSMRVRMEQIAASDPNEAVQESATQALLNWTTDPAFAAKVWKKKAFDDGYRRMTLEWWSKNQPDLARTRALEALAAKDSEPVRITAAGVLGRVKDKPGATAVFLALASLARESAYHARNAAITALGELGNKDAIPVLEPITKRAPFGVRGTAQAALDKLKKA